MIKVRSNLFFLCKTVCVFINLGKNACSVLHACFTQYEIMISVASIGALRFFRISAAHFYFRRGIYENNTKSNDKHIGFDDYY